MVGKRITNWVQKGTLSTTWVEFWGEGGRNGTTQNITGTVGGNNQPLKLLLKFLGVKKNRGEGGARRKETQNCR